MHLDISTAIDSKLCILALLFVSQPHCLEGPKEVPHSDETRAHALAEEG